MIKYLERRLATPGILIFQEKHHTRYFMCQNKEDFCRVAMKILSERVTGAYCWYDDDPAEPATSLTRAQEIIIDNDLEAAYEFLDLRSDWEYEGMTIEYSEKY